MNKYRTKLIRPSYIFFLLGLSLLGSMLIGAYSISLQEVGQTLFSVLGLSGNKSETHLAYLLFEIRLPRVLLSIVVGAGLGFSGAAIQGLFRNPLADPALLGITSGAMVFAVAGILFANSYLLAFNSLFGYAAIALLAFLGSTLTTLFVYRLGAKSGRSVVTIMLLAGIAITALGGALTGLMTYFSSEDELRDITFWTLGSIAGANWQLLAVVVPAVVIPMLLLLRMSRSLDLILLGEQEASYLGVNIQQLKWRIILCTAMMVGACVAVSGVIAFVALAVPHLVRLIFGTSHKTLLPGSAFLGAMLLLWADNFARIAIAPAELPIGILTALFGAPFFIWLLLNNKSKGDVQ